MLANDMQWLTQTRRGGAIESAWANRSDAPQGRRKPSGRARNRAPPHEPGRARNRLETVLAADAILPANWRTRGRSRTSCASRSAPGRWRMSKLRRINCAADPDRTRCPTRDKPDSAHHPRLQQRDRSLHHHSQLHSHIWLTNCHPDAVRATLSTTA